MSNGNADFRIRKLKKQFDLNMDEGNVYLYLNKMQNSFQADLSCKSGTVLFNREKMKNGVYKTESEKGPVVKINLEKGTLELDCLKTTQGTETNELQNYLPKKE